MKLLFKERFFSWLDSYDVFDENEDALATKGTNDYATDSFCFHSYLPQLCITGDKSKVPCFFSCSINDAQPPLPTSDIRRLSALLINVITTQKKKNPVFSNVIQLTNSVTSHTRAKHFAVWCGACSPDWARGRFPLAEDQFGMENAPLPVTV